MSDSRINLNDIMLKPVQYNTKLKLKLIYFLLSATSSMPLALYNGTHTLV